MADYTLATGKPYSPAVVCRCRYTTMYPHPLGAEGCRYEEPAPSESTCGEDHCPETPRDCGNCKYHCGCTSDTLDKIRAEQETPKSTTATTSREHTPKYYSGCGPDCAVCRLPNS